MPRFSALCHVYPYLKMNGNRIDYRTFRLLLSTMLAPRSLAVIALRIPAIHLGSSLVNVRAFIDAINQDFKRFVITQV